MTNIARHIASQLKSWAYWQLMNRLRDTKVEGGGVSPRALIGKYCIVRRGSEVGHDVVLGDYSYISGPRSYVEAARIGKFCSIARQVVIGVSDHDIAAVTTHPFRVSPEYGGLVKRVRSFTQKPPPIIGNDVWIGMNSVIMRGVIIGNGAVVAANSVVTKDIPPYAIFGGIPAKLIKNRFSTEIAQSIQRTEWWNWPPDKLLNNVPRFDTPMEFCINASQKQ